MVKINRRTRRSHLWKQAERRAKNTGREGDIDYILRIFKQLGGNLKSTCFNEIGVY